ncbi:hypothetical protein [Anaerostipes caccae]|uniref:hypothetical protein n=1 Tax=Anaerostipes caccae TaxID=105841 RepID=UPI0038D47999
MRKLIRRVVPLIFTIFIVGGCSHNETSKVKNEYTNYKTYAFADDFTYKVPANWEFNDSSHRNFFHYKNKYDHSDGMLNVLCAYGAEGLVSDKYSFDTWIRGVKSGNDYAGEIKITIVKVDGQEAKRYSHRLKIENQIYYIDNVVFNCINGWGYVGLLTLNKGDYSDRFNRIINSIDINEDAKSTTKATMETTEATTKAYK